MRKALLFLLLFYGSVYCQVKEKEKFLVRVLKVTSAGNGCKAEVDSDKVRYKLSADVSGACAMLRAGEQYKAYVASVRYSEDLKDDSKDRPVLIVENNTENPERKNAVFDIESQEARE